MADSSVKDKKVRIHESPLKRSNQVSFVGTTLSNRDQQSTTFRTKNILESQITQQNSGISYALKGHLFIMNIEKIKMRAIFQTFHLLRKNVPIISEQTKINPNQPLSQQQSYMKNDSIYSNNISQMNRKNIYESSQITVKSILQQFKLKNSSKFLNRQLFQCKMKLMVSQKNIINLQAQIAEYERRQERQMIKKRASLQGLSEQLKQKNEAIEQLKLIVKNLQAKMNLKKDNVYILEEDAGTLLRSVTHLQGINDKLNYDLSKLRQNEKTLQEKIRQMTTENQKLNGEIKIFRQKLFSADNFKHHIELSKKQCDMWEKRLIKKQSKLALVEKRINSMSKDRQQSKLIYSEKLFKESQTSIIPQQSLGFQRKLESVFSYFYHLEDKDYALSFPQLFDEEQKKFLLISKQKAISILQWHQEEQLVHNIKSPQLRNDLNQFGLTFIELVEEERQQKQKSQKSNYELKQLKFENERNVLRDTIQELKQKQLIVRSVLLNFIKSLELKSIKKQSSNILDVLFQCFQYSEDQRESLFQPKARKLFGFI